MKTKPIKVTPARLHHASYTNGQILYSPTAVKYDKPMRVTRAPMWLVDIINRATEAGYQRGYAQRGADIRAALGASARIGNMPR